MQTHLKYKSYNRFVSPSAKYEYEVDLMFISKPDEIIGLVCVKIICIKIIFTKIAIKDKQPDERIYGLKYSLVNLESQRNFIQMKKVHLIQLNI